MYAIDKDPHACMLDFYIKLRREILINSTSIDIYSKLTHTNGQSIHRETDSDPDYWIIEN